MVLYTILGIYLVWNIVPHLISWLLPIPTKVKVVSSLCWLKITALHLINLPVSLVAPIVVPVALFFTKWEDNNLPWLFRPWDNDVSINGDRAEDWGLDNKSNAYYAKAPPRSFWARFVWLGIRNRASHFSQALGYRYKEGEFDNITIYGNDHTSRTWPDGEGWVLRHTGPVCQLMVIKHITKSLCIRIHWGNKLFDRERAPIVAISFSILSWRADT